MSNFALVGVAGYIAPRHLDAIRDTGNVLVAAYDPRDSVGLLDRYDLEVAFTTDEARFAALIETQNRSTDRGRIDYVSICSPNHRHFQHCQLALTRGADVICEKPLTIVPEELAALKNLEVKTGRRVYTVLQLRVHESLVALQHRLAKESARKHDVLLTYVTGRGAWYHASWKGIPEKSGGIATNIGIHLFDLLMWLFGGVEKETVHLSDSTRMSGVLHLARARVRWFLSVVPADVPPNVRRQGRSTYRSIAVDGEEIDFSEGFSGLHTRVYESILAGAGLGIEDARPSVELTHRLRHLAVSPIDGDAHPLAVFGD